MRTRQQKPECTEVADIDKGQKSQWTNIKKLLTIGQKEMQDVQNSWGKLMISNHILKWLLKLLYTDIKSQQAVQYGMNGPERPQLIAS